MASANWDPNDAKAQLRTTSQRLGQLQEKIDSQAITSRREIASLLEANHVSLARAKAQNLIEEDATGDLLEALEMHLGLILEHFQELEPSATPSPTLLESASTVVFASDTATSRIQSNYLDGTRELLMQRLGNAFATSSAGGMDRHISPRVNEIIMSPPASASQLDNYLMKIADTYQVPWKPEPRREDILNSLSDMLDPATSPLVDLPLLRTLCSRGIPDEPGWIRPRIWKLFFNFLPVLKSSWAQAARKQRDDYYELVRRLLEPFSSLPPPSTTLTHLDSSLLGVSHQLSRILPGLFDGLEVEPQHSHQCPLDSTATESIKLACSSNLDLRLAAIKTRHPQDANIASIPEIRLEGITDNAPSDSETIAARRRQAPSLLAASNPYNNKAHPIHMSALLRLLYLHCSINPGNISPHLPSLLVPLYSVLCQEVDVEDLAHVEADTFWLFESIVGEFSELEDEEGGTVWMQKFGQRLAWADPDLQTSLHAKGLDPALPHYSYRWLAPLLTQTLPLSTTVILWDALFSYPMRERNSTPKLDFLLDICTAMLIQARAVLLRLGKKGHKTASLWGEDASFITPPSPIRAWELGDAFLEEMSLLQAYPIDAAGGVDRLIQTASDLNRRRFDESRLAKSEPMGLAAKLKISMWKGFTNQGPSPHVSPDSVLVPLDEDEEDVHEELDKNSNATDSSDAPAGTGLTSRLTTTIWRGITNQSSMEPPLTPISPIGWGDSPSSPSAPPSPFSPATIEENLSPKSRGLWGYAEKLKDSDTAAALAKVSSNWRAKAMMGTWSVGRGSTLTPSAEQSSLDNRYSTSAIRDETRSVVSDDGRRGSLPGVDRSGVYSPPSMPAFFRPPRDSVNFSGIRPVAPPSPPHTENSLLSRTMNLQASLASLTRQTSPPARAASGPRPLLLGSSPITGRIPSRSANSTPIPEHGRGTSISQWGDVMRSKDMRQQHRDSLSSTISSVLAPDARRQPSGFDSDSGASSRIIPIGRRSLSPMAAGFRLSQRAISESSGSVASDISPPLGGRNGLPRRSDSGWGQIDLPDTPPTPTTVTSPESIHVQDHEPTRGSVVLSEPPLEAAAPLEPPTPAKRLVRKKTPPMSHLSQPSDTSDSSPAVPTARVPRIRSKRHANRPTNLKLQDINGRKDSVEASPNLLGVEWPPEEAEVVSTPKAAEFEDPFASSPRRRKASGDTVRKMSGDGQETRVRKGSSSSRTRKVSGDGVQVHRQRPSVAEEGDDEGYDDLLSAYESEDGAKWRTL